MKTTTAIFVLNVVLLLLCANFLEENKQTIHTKEYNVNQEKENLTKHLGSQTREILIKFAFAVEKYNMKLNKLKQPLGALHDYIFNLSDHEIIQIIVKGTDEHQEIKTLEKLERLTFGTFNERTKIERERIMRAHLKNLSPELIKECAIKVEKSQRNKNEGSNFSNKNEEMVEFILNEINDHPELASGFNSVCSIFDFNIYENLDYTEEMNLKNIMHLLSKDELKAYCLTLERYDIEHKPNKEGGIHNYINTLQKHQIESFVKSFLEEYPEMSSMSKLEEKRIEYDIGIN